MFLAKKLAFGVDTNGMGYLKNVAHVSNINQRHLRNEFFE